MTVESKTSKFQQLIELIRSHDIAKRFVSGSAWNFFCSVMAKAMVMIAGIYCARFLGKELYGQYEMVKSTISNFVVIGGGGLAMAATKYIAEFRNNNRERTASIYLLTNYFAVGLALVLAVLMYVLAEELSIGLLETPSLVPMIKLSAIVMFIVVINTAQDGVLAGFEDFKARALNLIVSNFVQSALVMAGAYFYGLLGAVAGYGVGFLFLTLFNLRSVGVDLKRFKIPLRREYIRKGDLKLFFSYFLPALLSTLLAAPTFWIIRLLLVRFVDFEAQADYAVADHWRTLVLFIPVAVSQILLPILSSEGSKNVRKFRKILNWTLTINAAIAAAVALVVIVGKDFIVSLYGSGFNDSMPLVLLAIACVFNTMSQVLGIAISSLARMWQWLVFNVLWAIVAIGFTYYFLKNGWGASGAALAVLISYIWHAIIQYIYIKITIRE